MQISASPDPLRANDKWPEGPHHRHLDWVQVSWLHTRTSGGTWKNNMAKNWVQTWWLGALDAPLEGLPNPWMWTPQGTALLTLYDSVLVQHPEVQGEPKARAAPFLLSLRSIEWNIMDWLSQLVLTPDSTRSQSGRMKIDQPTNHSRTGKNKISHFAINVYFYTTLTFALSTQKNIVCRSTVWRKMLLTDDVKLHLPHAHPWPVGPSSCHHQWEWKQVKQKMECKGVVPKSMST